VRVLLGVRVWVLHDEHNEIEPQMPQMPHMFLANSTQIPSHTVFVDL
jgi:hypothetical protein